MPLHRLGPLVGARLEDLREARMVVEHRQRITAALAGLDVAFEVDLRELIRCRTFEPMPRLGRFARCLGDPAVASEHVLDRARCWSLFALALENAPYFSTAPDRMRVPNREDLALHCCIRLLW